MANSIEIWQTFQGLYVHFRKNKQNNKSFRESFIDYLENFQRYDGKSYIMNEIIFHHLCCFSYLLKFITKLKDSVFSTSQMNSHVISDIEKIEKDLVNFIETYDVLN